MASNEEKDTRRMTPRLDTVNVEVAVGTAMSPEPFSALDGSTRQFENGQLRLIPYPTKDPNGGRNFL